jgi:hypothetical protein
VLDFRAHVGPWLGLAAWVNAMSRQLAGRSTS